MGRSVEGRPIVATRIGHGTPVLLFGGIHGDEPASVAVCEALLTQPLPSTTSLVVVPALNPDGLWRGQKNNAHDVDLNRNFPARSWVAEHRAGYFPGASPLSEPEAATLAALVRAFVPSLTVSVHQPFHCVNFDGPAHAPAQKLAALLAWPLTPDLGYPTPGSFGSWWGREQSQPVITLELPRTLDDGGVAQVAHALAQLAA